MFKQSIIDYPNKNELKQHFISVLMTGLAAVKSILPPRMSFLSNCNAMFYLNGGV